MIHLDVGQKLFSINHSSEVAAARRYGSQLAAQLGFDATLAGRLSIVITEAATNMLKHAGEGSLFITPLSQNGQNGIEVLALDRGPGISNLHESFQDGTSSLGTSGTGLGALRRQADRFDVHTMDGKGSAFYMALWTCPDKLDDNALQIGSISVPYPGELVSGDAWAVAVERRQIAVLVADGLGHGVDAAHASSMAVRELREQPQLDPSQLLAFMHESLQRSRGAAIALAAIDLDGGVLEFVGIGNIMASVVQNSARKQLVSHNGIVGSNMRKVQQFALPWSADSLCILCSDGISTQWSLDHYPGLTSCHPSLIAGIIYRDFARGRDDVTVLVLRHTGPAS